MTEFSGSPLNRAEPRSRHNSRESAFLPRPLGPERLLPLGHILLVAFGVDERRGGAFLEPGILGFHVEVTAVGAEEVIARQRRQDPERALVVFGDAWVNR